MPSRIGQKKIVKKIMSTFLYLSFMYLAYCALLFFIQRSLMYPGTMMAAPRSGEINIPGFERIWLESGESRVETWFIPPDERTFKSSYPVVVCAHGNAEFIDNWPWEFRQFLRLGIGILLVEYPGFGRSGGRPTQASITRAFLDAYDALVARPEVDADRILLMGRSLGGGPVCQLAARRPSAALVLLSTFTSARIFAIRYLAPGFLVRDPFDNLSVVKTYERPVLVIHGKRDEVIPYRCGKALAAAAPNGKLVTYICGHNNLPTDEAQFWRDMESFLREAKILAPGKEKRKGNVPTS